MLKSTSAERRARRQSSGSRSSLVTVRPLEHSRSPSRPSETSTQSSVSHKNTHNGSNDTTTSQPQQRTRSQSAKRPSVSVNQSPISQQEYAQERPQSKKGPWSNSPNTSKEHRRRRSSLSTRLGLTSPSMSALTGINRRTPSPAKKRRPADIIVTPANTTSAKGATLAPPEVLSQGGTFYTLESPMFALASTSDAPRTPLLHVGQFGDSTNGIAFRGGDDPDSIYRASYNWSAPKSQTTGVAVNTHRVAEHVKSNSNANDDAVRPEMEQRKRHTPPVYSTERGADIMLEEDQRISPRRRQKRSRDSDRDKRKNMLANALQRATEAVVLDNDHDFSAALAAYREACGYLSEVANRSSSEVDKNKLRDIRAQYTSRIHEIQQLDTGSASSHDGNQASSGAEDQPANRSSFEGAESESENLTKTVEQTDHLDGESYKPTTSVANDGGSRNLLSVPQNEDFMPAPLSPRRPPPQPPSQQSDDTVPRTGPESIPIVRDSRIIDPSTIDPLSWLDGAEEPIGQSPRSSHHSISSLQQLRRKHLRMHSTSTEAEFDAALDAAVEAAYDDGYEPWDNDGKSWSRQRRSQGSRSGILTSNDPYSAGRAERALARQRSRSNRQHQHRTQLSDSAKPQPIEDELTCSDEESERILERAHDSIMIAATGDLRTNPNPPRQSDSSSSSGRTWASSAASSLNTTGTSLSTVDENSLPMRSKAPPPMLHPPPAPPPTGALPLPPSRTSGAFGFPQTAAGQLRPSPALASVTSLQDRRLSNRKGKTLTIETTARQQDADQKGANLSLEPGISLIPPKTAPGALAPGVSRLNETAEPDKPLTSPTAARQISSTFPTPFRATFSDFSESSTLSPADTTIISALSNDSSIRLPSATSPCDPFAKHLNDRGLLLRNNNSSLSLRSKGLLTPGSDLEYRSPTTPLSTSFSPSDVADSFPGNQKQLPRAQPRPLESCPDLQILRPYWLMRCFYQTMSHPDGGYLTTKLCIPRKIWMVSNAKLKHLDDKIAYCDLLTSSLLKLGGIDNTDADAVLQEMEKLENVISQVQTNLSKKLGNEVGSQNITSLFKEAPASTNIMSPTDIVRGDSMADNAGNMSLTGSGGGKSSSRGYFSLRKLRGKASDTALAKSYTSVKESGGADGMKLSTVPMTSSLQPPSNRSTKSGRPVTPGGVQDVKAEGPNAGYMGALARLCDAVQVLDQIARQVEDPGLKHSSPTYVGLEMSSRHASEFFGLYICRFVLQDVTMLAEKHVKRASEYVLT